MAWAGASLKWKCPVCRCKGWIDFLYDVPEWSRSTLDSVACPPSGEEHELNRARAEVEHALTGCHGTLFLGGGVLKAFASGSDAREWLRREATRRLTDGTKQYETT